MKRGGTFALLIMLTGCSSGSSTTRGPEDRAALGVLRLADLPDGYMSKDVAPEGAALATCLGAPAPVSQVQAKTFTRGQVGVTSRAVVVATSTDARNVVVAFRGAKASACLQADVAAGLKASGLTVSGFTATQEKLDVPDSYAVTEMVSASTASGFAITFTDYTLGAAVGAIHVSLSVRTSSESAITLADSAALLKKAVDRVSAAS